MDSNALVVDCGSVLDFGFIFFLNRYKLVKKQKSFGVLI